MRALVWLACGLALSGCATVTRGTTEDLIVETSPPGANVGVAFVVACDRSCVEKNYPDQAARMPPDRPPRSGPPCVTPCTITVPRSDVVALSFAKPGYDPFTLRVEPKPSAGGAAGFAGNAIIGGAAGAVVDIASGAGLDHCPNPVVVNLRRVGSREPMPAPSLACGRQPARDPNGPVAGASAAN